MRNDSVIIVGVCLLAVLLESSSRSNEQEAMMNLFAHFLFGSTVEQECRRGGGGTHQEHAEGLPHDAEEEVQTRVPRHHKEVAEKEELPAAVVQQGIVLAAEQGLVGILGGVTGVKGQSDTTSHHLHCAPTRLSPRWAV